MMRSFIARLFKPRAPATVIPVEETRAAEQALTRAEKPRKMWRFKLPRRSFARLGMMSLDGNATNFEMQGASPAMQPSTASARRLRRPNIATTQRKLAASQRRFRLLSNQAIMSARPGRHSNSISRSHTYPSMKNAAKTSPRAKGNAEVSKRSLRRTRTGSSFRMKNERGSRIEVEFTDDGESMFGEDLPTGCRKAAPRYPVTNLTATPEHHPHLDFTPARACSALSTQYSTLSVTREDSRLTDCATEWESVAESCDEATEAWAEFHREQMIAKLAGMKIQIAPESQVYLARKAMRIHPHKGQRSRIPQYKRPKSCTRPVRLDSAMERKLSCC